MNTPAPLFGEIENMTAKEKTTFSLNACDVSDIQEWKPVIDSLSYFVWAYQIVKVYPARNDSG